MGTNRRTVECIVVYRPTAKGQQITFLRTFDKLEYLITIQNFLTSKPLHILLCSHVSLQSDRVKFFFAVWCIVFIYHSGSVSTEKTFFCGPTSSVINSSLLLIFLTILWQWFVDNDPTAPGDLVLYRTIDPNQSDYVRLNGTLVVFQDQDSNGKNGPEKILKVHAALLWGVISMLRWREFDMKLSRSFSLWKCSHFFFSDWPFGRANCRYLTSILSHC